jgi:antitoxin FitA
MPDILVRNVDDETVERLKQKAKSERASMSDTARKLLQQGLKPHREELVKELDRIRGMSPYSDIDSTDLIREDRDNDEPYR